MAGEHRKVEARRVVTGLNDEGKSAVVSDAITPNRVAFDACTVNKIWQFDALPARVLGDDASVDAGSIPPMNGFIYMVTTFPPDSEWDLEAGYAELLASSGGAGPYLTGSEIPGLHETDTVDIITVVSGELYALLETEEVLLKQGDSFVQRGTKHSWSNRSDMPCTIASVMVGASR
jgi:hypothetical protein